MSRPVSRGGRSPGPTYLPNPPGARLTRAPHPCPPPAVGYPSDVESVILGPDGVLANLKEGGAIVDMTTSTPTLAVQIAEKAAAKGVFMWTARPLYLIPRHCRMTSPAKS